MSSSPGLAMILRITGLVLAGLVSGCVSPLPFYDFAPRPIEVRVLRSTAESVETGRALISFLELRRRPGDGRVELCSRVLLESHGDTRIRIPVASMTLVSADLNRFGAPHLGSAPTSTSESVSVVAEPGRRVSQDVFFPLPAGLDPWDVDFSTLNLRCEIETGNRRSSVSVDVHGVLLRRYYYSSYYHDPGDPWFYDCDHPWVVDVYCP